MIRMSMVTLAATVIAAVGVFCAAAPEARRRDAAWKAPSAAVSRNNPLASRPDVAAGGRKLFLQRCGACHGGDGRGSDRAPDLSATDVQTQSDGALFWKISGGNTRAGMPAFSFLPEPQRWQLVIWLRELRRTS